MQIVQVCQNSPPRSLLRFGFAEQQNGSRIKHAKPEQLRQRRAGAETLG